MGSNGIKSPDEKTSSQRPEVDSASKKYTLSEQFIFGIKLTAVGGFIFLMLWLFEKM